jgi:hypothetical protein
MATASSACNSDTGATYVTPCTLSTRLRGLVPPIRCGVRRHAYGLWTLIGIFGAAGCGESDDGAGTFAPAMTTVGDGDESTDEGEPLPDDFLGACDTQTVGEPMLLGQCRDWIGTDAMSIGSECIDIGGTLDPTQECPAATRVGVCTIARGAGLTERRHYYQPDHTMESGAALCTALGGAYE